MGQMGTLQLRFASFELDEADARLKRDGKPVALPPKAFGVLCALARQPGVLVTKNALLDAVWGHQHVSESVLKTTISQVRAALSDDAASPRYIETASRLGYRFIGAAPSANAGEAQRAPARASATPAPVAVPDSFVGRRDALERLQACWQRARDGQRQLVWVAGDAGVGKSTLLETFVRASGAAAIAQGQCVEQYGTGEPYLPVLQALGDLCREYSELPGMMRAVAPTWLLQLPWLCSEAERAALARELVGVSQERMVREFHELMARFTAKQPLLFVIEDLHWSDEATLRLMDHFARQRGPARVLWISSFRLTQIIAEGHALQALRLELRMHRLAQEIVLDPFSEAEVAAYLRGRLPAGDTPEAFVRRVHSHTDGLPLFVVNVVDALLAAEGEVDARDRQRLKVAANSPLPVPEDLMGAVETRIGKLPAETITLLEAAAVCGVEFRAGVVAEICGRSLQAVIEELDRLVKQQFWLRHSATVDLSDGTLDAIYTFRHAIYRHVFYQRIGEAARLQLHRRVAQALAAGAGKGVPVAAAELASHHERGREPAQALRAYAQAAQVALRSFAPQSAYELCEHARTLLPQIPAGPDQLTLELGIQSARGVAAAQFFGVGSLEARAVFERVRELSELLPQHPARALALNGYGASLYSRGEYVKLQQFAEKLDRLQGPDRGPLDVMTAFFRAGATSARGQCGASTEWWLKAIALCESITDRDGFQAFIVDPEAGIRANSVRTLFERGLYDQARLNNRKAIAIAESIGQPLAISLAHWRAGMLEIRFDNPQKVLEHAELIDKIVARTCVSQGEGPSRYLRGWALARLGRPAEGIALIRDGLERHLRIGMVASSTEVIGYCAEALVLAGDWDGANRELARAFARARELDEQFYLPVLLMLQARVAGGQGDAAAARNWLREAIRTAREQQAAGFELKALLALVEHPASTADDRRELALLLESLTEGRDAPDVVRARALV
jgi:DNA-binding winged helix-turn-helix (wHTH) protein/tetratricopeptide (TPR) repeat protein/type II secretory pathway predicted ATPase ExeA